MGFTVMATSIKSSEIRGQVQSISHVQQKLKDLGAQFLSSYAFTDTIFLKPGADISKEYWRIRLYHKTNWNQKQVNLTYKKYIPEQGQHLSKILYQEYDCVEDTEKSLPEKCREVLHYTRQGLEFKHASFHIFLEDIEGIPSTVEIVSDLPLGQVKEFMASIGVQKYFTQSVPGIA